MYLRHSDGLQGSCFEIREEVAKQAGAYVTTGLACGVIAGIIVFAETDSVISAMEAVSYSSLTYSMIFGFMAVWQTQRALAAMEKAANEETTNEQPIADEDQYDRKQQLMRAVKNRMLMHLFIAVFVLATLSEFCLGAYLYNRSRSTNETETAQ